MQVGAPTSRPPLTGRAVATSMSCPFPPWIEARRLRDSKITKSPNLIGGLCPFLLVYLTKNNMFTRYTSSVCSEKG